jgi:hypothetical protein
MFEFDPFKIEMFKDIFYCEDIDELRDIQEEVFNALDKLIIINISNDSSITLIGSKHETEETDIEVYGSIIK